MRTAFGLACPRCGSQPLLGAPSDRHAWLCPACCHYFTTDLRPVPRRDPEPAVLIAAAKVPGLDGVQVPGYRAGVGSPTNPPGADGVRPQLAGPVLQPDQLALSLG